MKPPLFSRLNLLTIDARRPVLAEKPTVLEDSKTYRPQICGRVYESTARRSRRLGGCITERMHHGIRCFALATPPALPSCTGLPPPDRQSIMASRPSPFAIERARRGSFLPSVRSRIDSWVSDPAVHGLRTLHFRCSSLGLHPDWFATRVHRRIVQARWEADVRIIEGGHLIIFGAGRVRLSEVLCGPETSLPEPGLLFHSAIRHERSASLHPGGIVEYSGVFRSRSR